MSRPAESLEEFELREACKAKVDALFDELAKRNRQPEESAAFTAHNDRFRKLKDELVLWLQWNPDL